MVHSSVIYVCNIDVFRRVCACACVRICMCACVRICICACVRICTCAYMHVSVCACVYMCVCVLVSCGTRSLFSVLFVVAEKRVWLSYHRFLCCGFCAALIADDKLKKTCIMNGISVLVELATYTSQVPLV